MALPPPASSWVTRLLNLTGAWAPIETAVFVWVLARGRESEREPVHSGERAGLVVDVGVNLGYFSLLALGLGYDVVGFEPQRRVQPYLQATYAANRVLAHRWTLLPCAAGAAGGTIDMDERAETEWGVSRVRVDAEGTTPLVRLDDMLAALPIASSRAIDLLKIDVEGAEVGVLAGAYPLLAAKLINNVVVEIKADKGPGARRQIIDELAAFGYHCRQYKEQYLEHPVLSIPPRDPRLSPPLPGSEFNQCYDDPSLPEDFWFFLP